MFFESANKISVSSRSSRSFDLPIFTSRVLRGAMLIGLIFFQGVVCAQPENCEDIISPIDVPDDAPYECDIFDVSDVSVEAVGASFISAEVFTHTSSVDSGIISMGPGFKVIEGASFSASFVPNYTYFTCATGNCHNP